MVVPALGNCKLGGNLSASGGAVAIPFHDRRCQHQGWLCKTRSSAPENAAQASNQTIRQCAQCKQQKRTQTNRYTRSIVQMLSVPTWALQKEIDRQIDTERERQRQRERETERDRDRERQSGKRSESRCEEVED